MCTKMTGSPHLGHRRCRCSAASEHRLTPFGADASRAIVVVAFHAYRYESVFLTHLLHEPAHRHVDNTYDGTWPSFDSYFYRGE